MANGELVFDAPWQSRVFGIARTLCENGMYEWDEFRACLIASIDDWARREGGGEYRYYDLFLSALTTLLAAKGIVLECDLVHRSDELAARPHGHDHG